MVVGILSILTTMFGLVFLISTPKIGTIKTFAKMSEERIGEIYVLGRYQGLIDGWDISFFHRDRELQWLGYYLAHESRRLRTANLQIVGDIVFVNDGNQRIAEYDTITGSFSNKLNGFTYSKQDGRDGGIEVRKWNLGKTPK